MRWGIEEDFQSQIDRVVAPTPADDQLARDVRNALLGTPVSYLHIPYAIRHTHYRPDAGKAESSWGTGSPRPSSSV